MAILDGATWQCLSLFFFGLNCRVWIQQNLTMCRTVKADRKELSCAGEGQWKRRELPKPFPWPCWVMSWLYRMVMSTSHRFKYFTLGHFHILNFYMLWKRCFLSNSFVGVTVLSTCQPQPECPSAAREQVMDKHHQSTLSQVTMPTTGCEAWHSFPCFFGRDFWLTAAAGCSVQLGYLLYAVFQARFPGMVESRDASNIGKWWSPQSWWTFWLGTYSPSPVKSQQASAEPAARFAVKWGTCWVTGQLLASASAFSSTTVPARKCCLGPDIPFSRLNQICGQFPVTKLSFMTGAVTQFRRVKLSCFPGSVFCVKCMSVFKEFLEVGQNSLRVRTQIWCTSEVTVPHHGGRRVG